ncbi:MAG: thioredoxin domain-containing protein [Egibacteraceae bacterium]
MANELADAASPYLRQHAENPVNWRVWSPNAFEEARRRDVPVFLSVGYSSCHWCHVMAHESFEDDDVAAVLNERFVSVKVDREERPDVDSVYMGAVQAMTGHGGWPMSVFLTPDGEPFFSGTYWPRDDRQGMPGFLRVLDAVARAWTDQRDEVLASGRKVTEHLAAAQQVGGDAGTVDPSVTDEAAALCVRAWDTAHGGFGRAPKFPQAMTVDFLLAHHQRTGEEGVLRAAAHSLTQMSRGGIYDHVAGGFSRYSVDAHWLVPHFEKMLYDNALLLRAYTHAWQITGERRFRRVATETADYLLREMRHDGGGFYSATDADSEGIEGKFFVWSKAEFDEVVAGAGEDPAEWGRFFGVTDEGNFEDPHHPEFGRHTILHEPHPRDETDEAFAARLARVRQALYEGREARVRPGLDDKVLTSWNALALGALAETGAVLGRGDYVEAARACAGFLRDEARRGARLQHSWKDGHGASVPAFLEDVAYLAQALLVLYEADPDPEWFAWARRLAADADARFADGDTGTYFSTAEDAEQLLTRPKDLWDNATPTGSSVMADVHLRLGALTADPDHVEQAQRTIAVLGARATQAPTGFGELLRAAERLIAGPEEVAIVGDPATEDAEALLAVYRRTWRPGTVLAVGQADGDAHPVPLLHDRPRVDGRATAYVCRNFACERPVTEPDELARLLAGAPEG